MSSDLMEARGHDFFSVLNFWHNQSSSGDVLRISWPASRAAEARDHDF